MDHPTKIAFLIPNLQGGGAERVFVTLLRRLDRDVFAPELVVGRLEGAYVGDLPSDINVIELGGLRARNVLQSLPSWVRKARPQLVCATTGFAAAAALTRPAWPSGTALVSRLANTLSSFYSDVRRESPARASLYKWFNRILYLGSDAVVCQSDAMLEDAERQIDLGRAKFYRIHNPVDVDYVQARSLERIEPRPGGSPSLVAVGNLHWRKGYDVLLRSFALLQGSWPSATLNIYGEGEQRPVLERLAVDLGIQNKVRLPGFAKNPYALIRHADLLVSSSRYEGFANVIVEALALETPVVATDCPGSSREVLTDGIGGRLAEPESAEDLAMAIDRALHDLARLRESIAGSRIAERFGVDTIVGQYEHLFSELRRRNDGSRATVVS